jgi:hypothetical protein
MQGVYWSAALRINRPEEMFANSVVGPPPFRAVSRVASVRRRKPRRLAFRS